MDTRGLEVLGAPSERARQMVGGVCLTAMEELGYRSTRLAVEIRHDPHDRPGVEASSSAGGICVSPDLLDNPVRLVWILSEEVAHAYLREAHGIANGGDFFDRFAQEAFASWFQTSRTLANGLVKADDITTTPIPESDPTPAFGGELGKHVGAALGGSHGNWGRLQSWFQQPGDEPLKAYVRELVPRLPPKPRTPRDMAVAVVREHERARRSC